MNKGYTYWRDGAHWVGFLDDFPDYWTQGESLTDLEEHLTDLWRELSSESVPNVRHHATLELA
ncbi:MAG: hypothetical protein LBG65_04380 [Puniceicoccales bacterium]|jgi:predicted RNase H-like HicB family nuclease|nr:hypothetical protein [Puniceicoccales bacterium]